MTMADTVAVMNKGRIEQMGPPVEIYDLPRTAFVANFLGQSNLLEGSVTGGGDLLSVSARGHQFGVPAARSAVTGGAITIGVRPEKLSLAPSGQSVESGRNALPGKVTDASFTGVSTQYLVMTPWDTEWVVFEQNRASAIMRPGDDVTIHWEVAHTFGLAPDETVHLTSAEAV